ncbi:MAG: MgtC/SapB family protein [Verrucomicrobiae bacterium]|nr:MgtC/SapB family protein [Verrucomicrobiae bacterium]
MLSYQEIILRLVTSAILGGIVGLERERLEWAAGLRTHMLVCLGSALIMIVSSFGFADILTNPQAILDPSRVAAQVVSGIGFLGAGTILFFRQEIIRGLTTAASLWTMAGVGLAVGGGLYFAAFASTGLIVVILAVIKPWERRLFPRQKNLVTLLINRHETSLKKIEDLFQASGLTVKQLTLKQGHSPNKDYAQFELERSPSRETILTLVEQLQKVEGVQEIKA